ncbi:MAG: O-antigen ligase family protein [Pseudomonadota bacterium]
MTEKQILIIFLLLTFTVCAFIVDRKVLVYLLVGILPLSFTTSYGPANVYLILGVAGIDLLKSLGRQNNGQPLSLWPIALLVLLVFAYLASFSANYWYMEFPKGFFKSSPTLALLTMASCVALFFLVVSTIETLREAKILLGLSIVAYFLSAGAAVFQILDPTNIYFYEYFTHYQSIAVQESRGGVRVYGTLGEYELFAEYSAIVVVLCLYFALRPGLSLPARFMCFIPVAASFYFLMMTKTRGALIALTLALGYMLIAQVRLIGVARTSMIVAVIVSLYAGSYLLFSNAGNYNTIDHLTAGTNVSLKSGNFDTRTRVWTKATKVFVESPQNEQLWGKGPGIPPQAADLDTYPHSLYLYTLLSVGAVGLMGYLFWFGFLLVGSPPGGAEQIRFAVFLKAALILFLIDQLKIEFLRLPAYQHIIWVLMALVFIANKQGFREGSAATAREALA